MLAHRGWEGDVRTNTLAGRLVGGSIVGVVAAVLHLSWAATLTAYAIGYLFISLYERMARAERSIAALWAEIEEAPADADERSPVSAPRVPARLR